MNILRPFIFVYFKPRFTLEINKLDTVPPVVYEWHEKPLLIRQPVLHKALPAKIYTMFVR
ncbi:MAG: hypothetical protein QW570_05495 [Candidatus Caldarchaeum sp.]